MMIIVAGGISHRDPDHYDERYEDDNDYVDDDNNDDDDEDVDDDNDDDTNDVVEGGQRLTRQRSSGKSVCSNSRCNIIIIGYQYHNHDYDHDHDERGLSIVGVVGSVRHVFIDIDYGPGAP